MAQVKRKAVRSASKQPGPKAILALALPAASTLVLALLNEFVTVHVSSTLKAAIVGFVAALFGALGAYLGSPGSVIVND